MPTQCARCRSPRRRTLRVVNASTRERLALCAKCVSEVLRQLSARSRRAVEVEIIKQSSRVAS
jgi:hypothetical protein